MAHHDDTMITPASAIGAVPTVDTNGGEPMTEKQSALLRHLCFTAGEPFDTNLTRRQARQRIDILSDQIGRT